MSRKVSIVMPVLNGQKYIGQAIESIAAQTFTDFELIVVNDGSTDGTVEILKRFAERIDLKIVHHATPQGIARSVNDGIRHATGQFIAFLDHDDLWFPTFLATQMAHLEKHPEVGMVHSDFQTIDGEGNILEASVAACRERHRQSGIVFAELFMDSFIVGNSVLIRKECFERLGTFDESLRIGDYHMWMRIARHYRVDYTPQVLTVYRQHGTQDSRTFSAEDIPPGLMALESILKMYPEVRKELGSRRIRRRIASLYLDMAYPSLSKGQGATARVFLRKAIRLQPFDFRLYVFYSATFLPASQIHLAKKIWHAIQHLRLPRASTPTASISNSH